MLDAIRFLFRLLQSSYKAAVHGCHCQDDERMRNVLAMPRSWSVCFAA